mmetsp:Transcript_25792/g.60729  ORF Transcript_25792/g.60729 Transcript_25792/m.60729 type:complete len:466 (-) Transcript_25792:95-1492(-)
MRPLQQETEARASQPAGHRSVDRSIDRLLQKERLKVLLSFLSLGKLVVQDLAEFDRVFRKAFDALVELVLSAAIRVKVGLEGFLVELVVGVDAAGGAGLGVALSRQRIAVEYHERFQQIGRNGHLVDPRQGDNLVHVAPVHGRTAGGSPRGGHADGLVPVFLEVGIDSLDQQYARIGGGMKVPIVGSVGPLGLVPVQDASRKGRHQIGVRLGGGRGLQKGKDERDVAVDALLFQNLGGLDALPGPGQLDEDAALVDAHLFVHLDDSPGPLDAGVNVVAEPDVDLGRYLSGHQCRQFGTEADGELVHGEVDLRFEIGHGGVPSAQLLLGVGNGFGNHVLVALVAAGTRLAHKERVGRGIGHESGGGVLFDHVEIAAVDRDGGHLGQFLEGGGGGYLGRSECGGRVHGAGAGEAAAGSDHHKGVGDGKRIIGQQHTDEKRRGCEGSTTAEHDLMIFFEKRMDWTELN